jgi:hypothetical protein
MAAAVCSYACSAVTFMFGALLWPNRGLRFVHPPPVRADPCALGDAIDDQWAISSALRMRPTSRPCLRILVAYQATEAADALLPRAEFTSSAIRWCD